MQIKASSIPDMEDVYSTNLHTIIRRPRSKSLGEIKNQQNSAYLSAASGHSRQHDARISNRSRSACGRLCSVSFQEWHSSVEHDRSLINTDFQEIITLRYDDTYEDIAGDNTGEASSPIIEQEDRVDDESEVGWSLTSSDNSSVDQDTTLWSMITDPWSPSTSASPASAYPAPPIPLPEPNTLTSTYLPFSFHLALTNHLTPTTLAHFESAQTPIFIHGMLQLPCTLSALLDLPASDLLCRLTPAVLLNHTTYLDATTLLPSLVKSTLQSAYQHVNGLVYFPKSSACVDKIKDFFATQLPMQSSTITPRAEMKKVTTQVEDSNGKRHDLVAWAWVARTAEGTEEWWTCEDFVAGRVVGLQNVQW